MPGDAQAMRLGDRSCRMDSMSPDKAGGWTPGRLRTTSVPEVPDLCPRAFLCTLRSHQRRTSCRLVEGDHVQSLVLGLRWAISPYLTSQPLLGPVNSRSISLWAGLNPLSYEN